MKKVLSAALALLLLHAPVSVLNADEPTKPAFPIADPGTEFPIRYEKYGNFTGIGTNSYKYKIADRPGLVKASGAGVTPNVISLPKDPAYIKWKATHPGPYNAWDYVGTDNPQDDFYIWATARDVGPGAKLLFTGKALDAAGHHKQALKAFHAIMVQFPREACWSADHTFVWYVANEAISQIDNITRHHPELKLTLAGAKFKVTNGNDTNFDNDEFIINPGVWEKKAPAVANDVTGKKIINQRGYGKVKLVQFENKHWQMRVDDKPFVVKGVTYSPVPVGQHLSSYGLRWQSEDTDGDGQPDSPYQSWVDKNNNDTQDADEKAVGDFELMKQMGVNAIRVYRNGEGTEYDPSGFNKKTLRDLHEKYGISVIMGDFLGAYTVGSGALWDEGTDYKDPVQLENMRRIIIDYVKDHKSEPYVLMWLLGNENLMPADYTGVNASRTKAASQIEEYMKFVNEIAELIHRIDPDHPVAVGNLDLVSLDEYGKYAPAVDIFGANSYRGASGFGTLWRTVQDAFDRPVMITEYGCDAWDSRKKNENQKMQADYLKGAWDDIRLNMAGGPGSGNAIGGVLFEFIDEWWKSSNGSWDTHDSDTDSAMAFPDGWGSEEYFGVVTRGDGHDSLERRVRQSYSLFRDQLWK